MFQADSRSAGLIHTEAGSQPLSSTKQLCACRLRLGSAATAVSETEHLRKTSLLYL